MITINFTFLLAGLCAFLWAIAPAYGEDLRRIHYGTTASISHLPIWVAKDAGFFAKKSLNVEPVQIRGGALITMGIMSGQLQFSGAGAESVVAARTEGGDVFLLACPPDLEPICLITRPAVDSSDHRVVEDVLGDYTAVNELGRKDQGCAERSVVEWTREKYAHVETKPVETFALFFKPAPYLPDKGIENVLRDVANRR